jgi:hypothetical protein
MSRELFKKLLSKSFFYLSLDITTILVILLLPVTSRAGEWPQQLHIYLGSTPKIDGIIEAGEWDDATTFSGTEGWTPQFTPATDSNDYSIKGWAKHDGENLYFAFDVKDDVLYGIDTPRWLPDENHKANELTREGFPWFGDGIELLINASNAWSKQDGQNNSGDGSSWQMVCNATKSRLGGIGHGGLLEGEERSSESAWNTYQEWIKSGAMKAAVKIKDNGKGFYIEWMIKAKPCLEVKPGFYWNPDMGTVKMGFNIGAQDLDEKDKGAGNWGNFHHEEWWAGEKDKRTWLKQWGTLYLHPSEKDAEIYVAVDGNDNNPGTKSSPLATLSRARDVVRDILISDNRQNITVYFKKGEYKINETVFFGPQDSGNENCTVTYTALPNNEVSFSGGKNIIGWQRHKGNIWKAKVDFPFRQFYVKDKRAIRARTPNGPDNYYRIIRWDDNAKKIVVNSSEISDWKYFRQVEMVVQFNWSESHLLLNSYKTESDGAHIDVQNPARDIVFVRPYPPRLPGHSYHFENAYEFLDEFGEWYQDVEAGVVYFIPFYGNDSDFVFLKAVAPTTETLIKIQGVLEQPVKNLKFKDITFEYTTWLLPSKSGIVHNQGGMYNIAADVKNNQHCARPPAAVYIAAAENVIFERNIFRHMGACAIDLDYATRNCKIIGNVIYDISGNGIQHARVNAYDGAESHEAYNPQDKRDISVNNLISNNYIGYTGRDYYGTHAIFCGWPQGVRIEHNEIEQTPYSAISVGWGWVHVPNAMRNNKINYNYIHNSQTLLGDSGAIYTLSPQPGSEIAYNYIKDVKKSPWTQFHVSGIYQDEGSDGFEVHHNVIDNVDMYPYFLHQVGHHIIQHDNCFRGLTAEYEEKQGFYEAIINKAGLQPEYRDIKKKIRVLP